MERTNEVRLYGSLGARFGRRHAFVAHTPRGALNALIALKPGFSKELATSHERSIRYAVFVGRDNLTQTDLDQLLGDQPVRIIPVVAGSKVDGLWQTIGGVALFSAGAVSLFWSNPYAYYMMGLGASLALGGVSQMISPHMPTTNHALLPPQNTASQGGPVPILYGRMRIGSTLISACVQATDVKATELAESTDDNLGRHKGPGKDSLLSKTEVEIVDLISEGPIAGLYDTKDNRRSIFFDGVPLDSRNKEKNFNVSKVEFRKGECGQEAISWLNVVSSETPVGMQLHHESKWELMLAEPDVDEIAINVEIQGLYRKDKTDGEQPSRIECQLDVLGYGASGRESKSWKPLSVVFDGLCRHSYERTIQLSLTDMRAKRYKIVLRRLTGTSTDHFGTVFVKSYDRRRRARLRYPMSAVAAFRMDSANVRNMPVRAYDVKGLIVSVPSNYDAEARTYSGDWDGQFKHAWTSNPAWIFYDMLLNRRYGAGSWIDESNVDRYALYAIGRYCDERVADGRGGTEPRFSCNCYITSRTHAFALLQQLASVFRGMAYWSGGTVISVADLPQDPTHIYVPANVIDGEFRYMGSSLKTRYTVAMVSWHDPDNEYRRCVESVEDAEGVERYGENKVEVDAFGCTSRGQAQRVGYWFLLTSRLETDTVVFGVGLDGVRAQPGQIISVCDPARSCESTGGRIKHGQQRRLILDRAIGANTAGTLKVVMPDGSVESYRVKHADGPVVELDQPLAQEPVDSAVWLFEADDAENRLYRVASVSETEDGTRLTITATQHEPAKFSRVDRAAMIDLVPEPVQPVDPVKNLVGSSRVTRNPWRSVLELTWDGLSDAVEYEVRWCASATSSYTSRAVRQPKLSLDYLQPGRYTVCVVATLRDGRRSQKAEIQAVLHGLAYPTGLRAEEEEGSILLICEAAGPAQVSAAEYALASTADIATSHRLLKQGRAPLRHAASLKEHGGGYAWVRVGYMLDAEVHYSEWYPPETGAGVRLPAC